MSNNTRWTEEDLKRNNLVEMSPGVWQPAKKVQSIQEETVKNPGICKHKKNQYWGNDINTIEDIIKLCNQEGKIFIPNNVPSKKNSKQAFIKNGRQTVISSKLCRDYEKKTRAYYHLIASRFHIMIQDKAKPYNIKFTFVRPRNNNWDHNNVSQMVQDQMVKFGWIEDDSHKIINPSFGDPGIDTRFPGVIINVL